MSHIKIKSFFDEVTCTVTYIVIDTFSNKCSIVDPVLDYKQNSGKTETKSADILIQFIQSNQLDLEWIIETHAHADHLSSAPYLKDKLGGKTAIGEHITQVQEIFKGVFNLEKEFLVDGSQFDHLLTDNQSISLGESEIKVIHTPGHTPACVTLVVENNAIVGDTLFMPDIGTARCDFPGGDAKNLYQSIQRIYALPDPTKVFVGHDYQSANRNHFAWETTISRQKNENIHINLAISEKEFVSIRQARDSNLDVPKLILPSVQVNIRAGSLPAKESNGISYMKIPINAL
ncbi:MAG: glyoxylase-like metal-dependent hydrolase (beta-lactamase superfamily II) [Polaribacter sp.]|jgi:glyoxylase-like metal-dependent hydrolase (beta-lactamase superfamily II)